MGEKSVLMRNLPTTLASFEDACFLFSVSLKKASIF